MPSSRKLALRQETLADLTSDEMHAVAGGSGQCLETLVLPTRCACTGVYPTLDRPCATIQVTGAVCD